MEIKNTERYTNKLIRNEYLNYLINIFNFQLGEQEQTIRPNADVPPIQFKYKDTCNFAPNNYSVINNDNDNEYINMRYNCTPTIDPLDIYEVQNTSIHSDSDILSIDVFLRVRLFYTGNSITSFKSVIKIDDNEYYSNIFSTSLTTVWQNYSNLYLLNPKTIKKFTVDELNNIKIGIKGIYHPTGSIVVSVVKLVIKYKLPEIKISYNSDLSYISLMKNDLIIASIDIINKNIYVFHKAYENAMITFGNLYNFNNLFKSYDS
jgi:hypothetical protein